MNEPIKSEIEIFDKDIREYFVSKYGDTDVE